ncbi:hypothetical protein [Acidocella sp.]|uniref:hypothetical protein n=1 Tax=Acidocella sp. TaxID=50710 RepID=UPI003CFD5610
MWVRFPPGPPKKPASLFESTLYGSHSRFYPHLYRGVLVGADGEAWDDIVVVRYASFEVLRRILESAAYAEQAAPHRRAALSDWKFLITTQPDLLR